MTADIVKAEPGPLVQLDMATTTHVLRIPGWLPLRLNVLIRSHWSHALRELKTAAQLVGVARLAAGLPRVGNPPVRRRVSVTYSQPRGPAADPDARWKHLLDALVLAGCLVDDSPIWCEPGPVLTARGPRGTVVVLEDLT